MITIVLTRQQTELALYMLDIISTDSLSVNSYTRSLYNAADVIDDIKEITNKLDQAIVDFDDKQR